MIKKISSSFTLSLLLLFLLGDSSGTSTPVKEIAPNVPALVPGPDVIVGGLPNLIQAGNSGTQVGLAMGTDTCNNGDVELNFFAMPNTDHPVMPQNLYRMSGGAANDERFEQIGQSWLKHAFFALQQNVCGFGCTPASGGNHLGVGCSNPDSASLNANQLGLGSRAWVNPFTGLFPSTANSHTGHTHSGTAHRLLVEGSDLNTTLNPGATYYAEAQLVTPHEYAWCQANPGQCNMSNNVSYRQFSVIGTTSFTFSPVGDTVTMTPAINAWPGATIEMIEPEPGIDGRAFIAYKVTGPFGVENRWHYEYAIYNQNLDRGIQFFSVPGGCGMGTPVNLEFHAPLNHPGFAGDGTVGDAGYSNAPWTMSGSSAAASWFTETFAQNPNANALRWGTLYNFRFDTGTPPTATNATIGFFKTGTPITVAVLGPSTECQPSPSPTAPPSPSPTPTPPTTPTPAPCAVIALNEGFDTVTAPDLPPGWVSTFFQGSAGCTPMGICTLGTNWASSTNAPSSPPNCVFHDAPSCVTDSTLDTPVFPGYSGSILDFTHHYDVSSGFDGAVLEISIDGGPFIDFLAAGGNFFPGRGYNGTISTGFQNPLAGRTAWTGDSGGYVTTFASMPPAASGSVPVILRFRIATDCGGSTSTGWRLDNIKVVFTISCATPTPTLPPTPTPTATPSPTPTPPAQTVNLSTRMFVQTGDDVGIGGFIITGNAPKHLLFRGIGPSLIPSGITDALANPTLDLRDSAGVRILANNDWRETQETEIEATGIPPTNDLEAAIVQTLDPGTYTVILRGMGMTTGVGLVEIYDLDQGVDSKLANLSTRAFIDTGDNIVIAGFILGGSSNDRIVVRGIGPSLTALGVPNALPDPTLELRDGNGALLMANNDWQDDQAQAAELTAAGLAPTNNLESGIAMTLAPGLYTTLLAGANNGTGVGLVEVYDRGPPP